MDIPKAIVNLTVEKAEFIGILLTDESRGVIVGEIAFLDHLLGEVLEAYASNSPQPPAFQQSWVAKMMFNERIQTFDRLSLTGEAPSLRDQIVAALHPMRKLRNEAAHKAALTTAQADALYADPFYRSLLANFPANLKMQTGAVQSLLHKVQRLPLFQPK